MPAGNPTLTDIVASADKTTRYLGNQFVRANPMLQLLPFDAAVTPGSPEQILAYPYSRQKNMRVGQLRNPYEDYVEGFVEREDMLARLKIMGDAFGIDRVFAQADVSGFVELNVQEIALSTTALFNNLTVNGDSTPTGSKEFDGLSKILTGTTSEIDGAAVDFSAGRTDVQMLESLAMVKRYINKVRARGLVPVIMGNEDSVLRFETVATKLGFLQKQASNFGADIAQYASANLIDLGPVPSTDGSGTSVIPTTSGSVTATDNGLTDLYIVGFGLKGFHGVTLTGNAGVSYYSNLNDRTPGVKRRVECELVAGVALKDTQAAFVMRDIRIAAA